MQCDVTRCVICMSNTGTCKVTKVLAKKLSLYCEFRCSLQCNQGNAGQNFA